MAWVINLSICANKPYLFSFILFYNLVIKIYIFEWNFEQFTFIYIIVKKANN